MALKPMTSHPQNDMRDAILRTAIRLFRDVGYYKTTVADIAKVMEMSPANIYRFFSSKKEIHASAARLLMGEVEAAVETIVSGSGDPIDRLRRILETVHVMNAERYVADSKIHEMVAVAMEQSWDVCQEHIVRIMKAITSIIQDGVTAGIFHVDNVDVAASCTCAAMAGFFDPQMIAQNRDKPRPSLENMISFVTKSLTAP